MKSTAYSSGQWSGKNTQRFVEPVKKAEPKEKNVKFATKATEKSTAPQYAPGGSPIEVLTVCCHTISHFGLFYLASGCTASTDVSGTAAHSNGRLYSGMLLSSRAHCTYLTSRQQRMSKETGVVWSRTFKQHHGPVDKFIGSHPDIFVLKAGKVGLKVIVDGKNGVEVRMNVSITNHFDSSCFLEQRKHGNIRRIRSGLF